jgi:hypothetical protein
MGDLSKHFSEAEFRCKCHACQADHVKPVISYTLLTLLELLHCYFSEHLQSKVSITISSANRCVNHNKAVGGKPDSRHLVPQHGDAVDIVVMYLNEHKEWQQVDPRIVYDVINNTFTQSFGCHAYVTFTHIDVRPTRARW